MAQRLEVEKLAPTLKGRPAKYPWADWTDGSAWRIVQGDDYDNTVTMKRNLRQHASQHGFYVVIAENAPDSLDIQFNKKMAR